MVKLRAVLEQGYSFHEDGWTETLAGLSMLLKLIEIMEENGDTFNAVLMLRLVFISSSYLAEQTFNKTVQEYINAKIHSLNDKENQDEMKKLIEEKSNYSLRKIGISNAIKSWPKQLTGRNLDLGSGCLQSLREITNKRNDIIHKLNDLTNYSKPSKIASEVVYSSIEACKAIEEHFFPGRAFSYNDWLNTYPVKTTEYYKKDLTTGSTQTPQTARIQ